MTKQILFLLLSFGFPIIIYAQNWEIRGKINDSQTGKPLPFVNIVLDNSRNGTATDIDGNFSLSIPPGEHTLNLSYIGYEKKSVSIHPSHPFIIVMLLETSAELQEVSITPGENPAHRIIKKAVENKDKNNPQNLPSFSYRTYSKFIATINPDSIDTHIDTSVVNTLDSSYTTYDSSSFKLAKAMEKQYLFMMETVTERQYLPPSRDNETVLATRVSGFKNPLFSLLITQLQSFSFYGDYISIAGEDFLNPITPGSTKRYFFIIEDTTYNSPEDTVYIISFRPRPNYGFKPMKGVVYINTSDWAIQSVLAEPVENQGARISIEQRYREYAPHIWFPDQLSANIRFSSIQLNGVQPIALMRTYLKDVKIGEDLKKKNISRAEVTIDELAVSNADKILAEYRVDTISKKEQNTYHVLDSIGKASNLDRKLLILTTLLQGKIPVKFLDIDIGRVVGYNNYEGFRLGLGAHTNARFSRWFKVGGYFGYGFKDQVWKYGWDSEITLNKYSNLKLLGGYQYDIFESGGIHFIQEPDTRLLSNDYRNLFITQFDETSRYFAGLTYDPTPNSHLKIITQRENRFTIGDYLYDKNRNGDQNLENGFNYFEIIGGLRWAPQEKFVEGPDFGKLTFQTGYPLIYLQYTRGLSGVWNSEFDYDKIDLRLEHRIKTIAFGVSTIQLQGGTVLQDVPYSKLYVGTANTVSSDDFWKKLNLADRNSFETMRFNEFLSDTYVQVLLRQDFKTLLFRREKFAPDIELVARGLWGSLRSPGLHYNLPAQAPEKGYYEAGLELNKLYSSTLLNVGLGFYYRMGAYSLPTFGENFALKITSKYSF